MQHRAAVIATLACALAAASTLAATAETLIPRSRPDGASRHVLVESRRNGDVVQALHKRVRAGSTFYTRSEVDCRKRKMRILGQGDMSPARISTKPTQWFDPIEGSSNGDLARFLCKWPAAAGQERSTETKR
jgi:hypothetical protein